MVRTAMMAFMRREKFFLVAVVFVVGVMTLVAPSWVFCFENAHGHGHAELATPLGCVDAAKTEVLHLHDAGKVVLHNASDHHAPCVDVSLSATWITSRPYQAKTPTMVFFVPSLRPAGFGKVKFLSGSIAQFRASLATFRHFDNIVTLRI